MLVVDEAALGLDQHGDKLARGGSSRFRRGEAVTRYAFIFSDSFAITVEPFVVLDPKSGDENGARIQVRRVDAAGAEPGTHLVEPIWRGDLFRLTDGPKDNWDRAHYHPRFQGTQAGARVMDPELTRD